MALNDLERHDNSPYFAFFSPNSIALPANYVTVVEDRPTYNVRKILYPVPVFHFWPNPTHPATCEVQSALYDAPDAAIPTSSTYYKTDRLT